MRLLLDTHAFLWFIAGDERLSRDARAQIEDVQNQRILSIASVWETAIKVSIGKLTVAQPLEQLIPEQMQANAVTLLPIVLEHVYRVSNLPLHHRDPFDRLLVAQCLVEKIPLISADPVFESYDVERIW